MSLSTFNIIHIVVEVVSILSITAYFLHQNSKMMSQIDTLNSALEEHEEKITEQDKKISSIMKIVKKLESRDVRVEKQDDGCVNGVCPVPGFQAFPLNFQIPSAMKSFFDPISPSSSSHVQEIIVEEEDEDEDNDVVEDLKPTSVVAVEPVVEIVEEEEPNNNENDEEDLVKVQPLPPPAPKKKKKKKRNGSVSSAPDLDKELEAELNELNA